jgi:hypothetical protein
MGTSELHLHFVVVKYPKKKLCFHAWWVIGDIHWWFELSKNDTYEVQTSLKNVI